jgi:sulfur-oxidizing protein SoxY
MKNINRRLLPLIALPLLTVLASSAVRAEEKLEITRPKDVQSDVDLWATFLRDAYFKDVNLIEDKTVIDMKTPYRAEDAAVTPVTITAKFDQSPDRFIEKLYLIVDNNPQPLVGTFQFTPDTGKADIALRVRIDRYTNIRAVAVLNNGEHHMVTNYVKASGGCSDPFGGNIYDALKSAGKMKFKTVGEVLSDNTQLGQFNVSHPNFTGMSINQRTGNIVPPHFVSRLTLTYNGKVVMKADTGISISQDPSIRFFFKPGAGGKLRAEVEDSKGGKWAEEFDVTETASKVESEADRSAG